MPYADTAPAVSLVIPAYNEEENLADAVAAAARSLAAIDPAWELVLVDDGSADATGRIAEEQAAVYPGHVRVMRHPTNRGKGAALRTGLGATRAPVIGYTDADLPFDMEALGRAYACLLDNDADLVAGFRTNRERYSLRRRVYSGAYNRLVRLLLALPYDDVSFALKVMRREVFEAADLQSDGGFADVELLARAHAIGCRIERVGVAFSPREKGVSTMAGPVSVLGIARDLLLFRLGQWGRRRGVEQAASVATL